MTNPPVPAAADGVWHMLPKDIQPGDQVWVHLEGHGRVWAPVVAVGYDRGRGAWRVRFDRIRHRPFFQPGTRQLVRRDWDAWPESGAVPPCPACGAVCRLVGGTAMLRHAEGCRVDAQERATLN